MPDGTDGVPTDNRLPDRAYELLTSMDPKGVDSELLTTRALVLASTALKLGKVEEIARGNELSREVIEAVADQAYRQCHPLTNITVDAEWRRAMVPVMTRRVLREIAGT